MEVGVGDGAGLEQRAVGGVDFEPLQRGTGIDLRSVDGVEQIAGLTDGGGKAGVAVIQIGDVVGLRRIDRDVEGGDGNRAGDGERGGTGSGGVLDGEAEEIGLGLEVVAVGGNAEDGGVARSGIEMNGGMQDEAVGGLRQRRKGGAIGDSGRGC